MLEVYPIQTKEEQAEICKLCGIEYDVDKLAYRGCISGELTGAAQFGIHEKNGYIYDLENVIGTENSELLFVMGRAALNFIDMCGVHQAYFVGKTEGRETLISKIGFKHQENGDWFMDLTGFFESPCQCDTKN